MNNENNKKIVLRNFPYAANQEDLLEVCSHYGVIEHIEFIKKKSYCMVEYSNCDSAQLAIGHLNGIIFGGRRLRVFFWKDIERWNVEEKEKFFIRPMNV